MAAPAARKQITVLGSGWGALRILKDLCPKQYAISVVSPRNHMLFTPMLASAAVGTVSPRSICEPLRPHCIAKGAQLYEAYAQGVNLEKKVVMCKSLRGEDFPLPFDKLVISVGYRANDFGIPGVKANALFMKETADALKLREVILARLEQAAYTHMLDGDMAVSPEEEAELQQLLSIAIVGGGPTGVELAAELTDFVGKEVKGMYPQLHKYVTVHLVEGAPSLLNHLSDGGLRDYAVSHLTKTQGVKLHLEEFVAQATSTELSLKSGKTIPFGALVWCAGIKPVPFVKGLELTKTQNGAQILTDPTLRTCHPDIFAIGDCAQIDGNRLPQTAQVAKQQAQYLAKELNKGEVFAKPFVFKSLGSMAYLGSSKALIADTPVVRQMRGYLAWLGWRSAYWGMQLSMQNRLLIAHDWFSTWAFGRQITRMGHDSLRVPTSMVDTDMRKL